MAGKTSTIHTFQKRECFLIGRTDTSIQDERTRVFNIEELDANGVVRKFTNVGGHDIYQTAY